MTRIYKGVYRSEMVFPTLKKIVLGCALLAAVIVFWPSSIGSAVSLYLLYLGPLQMTAGLVSRAHMKALAPDAAGLSQALVLAPPGPDIFPRFAITNAIFTGPALVLKEIFHRRRFEAQWD